MVKNVLLAVACLIGCHPGLINAMQNTPKMYLNYKLLKATDDNNVQEIELLIRAGADIDYKDMSGKTALHITQNPEVVKMLIEAGADVNIKNNKDKTPLEDASIESLYGEDLGDKMRSLITSVSPQEIQHVIPGIISTKRLAGKDFGSIISSRLVQDIIKNKLTLAKEYLIPFTKEKEDEVRQEIIQNINQAITKSPYIQKSPEEPN